MSSEHMVNVKVEPHYSGCVIKFENGKTLFYQSDWDIAAFAYCCGLIPEANPQLLADVDVCSIDKAPDYLIPEEEP